MNESHVVAKPGDRVALCGDKGPKGRGPLPVVWAPYVWRHVLGHDAAVCGRCAAVGVVP